MKEKDAGKFWGMTLLPLKFSFFIPNHFIPQRLYPSFHSINTSHFFHKFSHQISTHFSNFYLIIIFSSSPAKMAKWMDTFFFMVITVLVVIMSFFCLHRTENADLECLHSRASICCYL